MNFIQPSYRLQWGAISISYPTWKLESFYSRKNCENSEKTWTLLNFRQTLKFQ